MKKATIITGLLVVFTTTVSAQTVSNVEKANRFRVQPVEMSIKTEVKSDANLNQSVMNRESALGDFINKSSAQLKELGGYAVGLEHAAQLQELGGYAVGLEHAAQLQELGGYAVGLEHAAQLK